MYIYINIGGLPIACHWRLLPDIAYLVILIKYALLAIWPKLFLEGRRGYGTALRLHTPDATLASYPGLRGGAGIVYLMH